MSRINVNHWVARFKTEGISGLHNKPGQGLKPVLDTEAKKGLLDRSKTPETYANSQGGMESLLGKSISDSTLRWFFSIGESSKKGAESGGLCGKGQPLLCCQQLDGCFGRRCPNQF